MESAKRFVNGVLQAAQVAGVAMVGQSFFSIDFRQSLLKKVDEYYLYITEEKPYNNRNQSIAKTERLELMEESRMKKNKKKLFDRIAPVYGMFYPLQKKSFSFVPKMMKEEGIFPPMQILDIGCGTGALLSVLESEGYQVTGVDPSKEMLRVAMWKTREQNIKYYHLKDQDTLPFKDNSFDAVISSHVLHGMPEKQRMQLYAEMKRIARRKVIIYDYNKNRSLHVSFIEYLEKGDYFRFIQVAEKEMKEVFGDVKITHVGKQTAWYVMEAQGPRIWAENKE